MSTVETSLVYRRLPTEEFYKLLPVYELLGDPLPVPENTVAQVAEVGGEIIGYIAGQLVICVSPLWVREDFRGQKVAEQLVIEGYPRLPKGMQKIFITRSRHVEILAHWMGFVPKEGKLFIEAPEGKV